MSGLLFTFLATLLAALGARDQLLVARMTAAQGPRLGVVAAALLSVGLTCAGAAWLAGAVAHEVPGQARYVFAGIALVLAGGEALLLRAAKAPEEPTRSLFALLVVLLAQQVTDAVRFMVLAIGIMTGAPAIAAAGGVAAGAIALGTAWTAPELAAHPALPTLRRIAGAFLLLAGAVLVWRGMN